MSSIGVVEEEETESQEEETESESKELNEEEEENFAGDEVNIKNPVFPYYYRVDEQDNIHFSAATQTPKGFLKPSNVFTSDHHLHNCIGGTLIEKYHETVLNYIENVDINDLSALRSEICERIQKRVKFQRSTYGYVSKCFDEQPQNLFSQLTASLFLVLYPDHFSFATSQKGFEIIGSIDDETGRSILSYISRGQLKPGLLGQLKNKNLVWYDGCLICEVIDCRRSVPRSVRTQLRVSSYDITAYGIESEQPFILVQNPFVCLEASPAVANVARVAMSDRLRWEPQEDFSTNENKVLFVARRRPDLFLRKNEKKENFGLHTTNKQNNYRQRMIESMLGITVTEKRDSEEK